MTRKRETLGAEDISDIPVAPSHRHPMSGEPIWDQAAVRIIIDQARANVIAGLEPVAWLHTMDNTDGIPGNEPHEVVTLDDCNPFGRPGLDYSASYPVTSEPLARIPKE